MNFNLINFNSLWDWDQIGIKLEINLCYILKVRRFYVEKGYRS